MLASLCTVLLCVSPAAPNLLAGLATKGEDSHRVGLYGLLGPGGFSTTFFANSLKSKIKTNAGLPTNMLIGVSESDAQAATCWHGTHCVSPGGHHDWGE